MEVCPAGEVGVGIDEVWACGNRGSTRRAHFGRVSALVEHDALEESNDYCG